MSDLKLISTRQAARLLGVRPNTLSHAVWSGRIAEPSRAPSGAFLWGEEDLRRAARALLNKPLEAVLQEQGSSRHE